MIIILIIGDAQQAEGRWLWLRLLSGVRHLHRDACVLHKFGVYPSVVAFTPVMEQFLLLGSYAPPSRKRSLVTARLHPLAVKLCVGEFTATARLYHWSSTLCWQIYGDRMVAPLSRQLCWRMYGGRKVASLGSTVLSGMA
jgi:hypothetical protein